VIVRFPLFHGAIPAMVAGVAFFLTGCQPKAPPRLVVKEEVGVDLFAQAENHRELGEFEEALKAYLAYTEQEPRSKKVPFVLERMAEIYLERGQYDSGLSLLKRISEDFPDYSKLPKVEYQIAKTYFNLGDYQHSVDEAMEWLRRYPHHFSKGDILLILGDSYWALGDMPKAFQWWLRAKREWPDDPQRQADLNQKMGRAANASRSEEEIVELARYAEGTDFGPEIRYRLASIYLERGDLEGARREAMSLERSAGDQSWVLLGRQLLDRVQAEMSVRRGVIGCLLPLSGPFSLYGEEVLNGIQLGMGIAGDAWDGPIKELVIKDTKGEPDKALAGMEELVKQEKVMAIIGPLSSRTAVAVAKAAQASGVPMIALTQKEGIVSEGNMVFRNFLTPSQEVERLIDIAVYEMGIKRFAILYPNNNYGSYLMSLFWDGLETVGGRVTAMESYDPADTDFADQIRKMTGLYYPRPASLVKRLEEERTPEAEESELYPKEPEPIVDFDAVFIPDNFERVAMITPQLAYHDVLDVTLVGTSLWQSPKLMEMAGDYVQGAIFPSGFVETSPEPGATAFFEEYRLNFGSDPGLLAATGYDTIRLLKGVMSGEGVRTRKDLQEALIKGVDFPGVTGRTSFDPQGEVLKKPLILTIVGNRMIPYH
jgi:branched-chain amino acid transport system substrate-binding protein